MGVKMRAFLRLLVLAEDVPFEYREKALDLLMEHEAPPPALPLAPLPEGMTEAEYAATLPCNLVAAVRAIRDRFGVGLMDAKNMINSLENRGLWSRQSA